MDGANTDKRLLITGGSGFIGRHVIPLAHRQGYQVLNVDLREPDAVGEESSTVIADIRNGRQMKDIFHSFDPTHVLHLASDTDISLSRAEDFTTVTDGSQVMFDIAAKFPSVCRFVHVSTQYVVQPGLKPKDEQHYAPYTIYGEAKAESEKRLWQSDLGCWTILRPTIVWGPYHPTFPDQLWKYINKRVYFHPATREPILRNYGYVENVADQMIQFLGIPVEQCSRKVYYLGDMNVDYAVWVDAFSTALTGKNARRIPKIGLLCLALLGEVAELAGVKFPFDKGRYHRMTTPSSLDLTPTLQAVGMPKVTFEDAVQRTVAWLQEYWSDQPNSVTQDSSTSSRTNHN